MFPTEIASVLFLLGFIIIALLSNEVLLYMIAGMLVLIMNFRDTTDQLETVLMGVIAIYIFYRGAYVKK